MGALEIGHSQLCHGTGLLSPCRSSKPSWQQRSVLFDCLVATRDLRMWRFRTQPQTNKALVVILFYWPEASYTLLRVHGICDTGHEALCPVSRPTKSDTDKPVVAKKPNGYVYRSTPPNLPTLAIATLNKHQYKI